MTHGWMREMYPCVHYGGVENDSTLIQNVINTILTLKHSCTSFHCLLHRIPMHAQIHKTLFELLEQNKMNSKLGWRANLRLTRGNLCTPHMYGKHYFNRVYIIFYWTAIYIYIYIQNLVWIVRGEQNEFKVGLNGQSPSGPRKPLHASHVWKTLLQPSVHYILLNCNIYMSSTSISVHPLFWTYIGES